MDEKRVVFRNLAIALSVIVVVLLAVLLGAVVNYTSIINERNSVIAARDSQIEDLTNQVAQLQAWLDGNETELKRRILEIQGLTNKVIQLEAWLDGNRTEFEQRTQQLQLRIEELEQQSIQFQQQIMRLRASIDSLMMPKLIKVGLEAYDNRSWLGAPYLHIHGYICNVGTYTALNSTIHVVALQSEGVVAIDTYIDLGEIEGESWRKVDSKIYYGGSELVNWTLTLEWASPPLPC